MKNAILVHGMPSRSQYDLAKLFGLKISRFHWFGWLRKQLERAGYRVHAPEMPRAYKPDYNVWKEQVERAAITEDTLLVGHSCGAGFWLRYLSENPEIKVGKVVLVAPWIDVPRMIAPDFFDFQIDSALTARTKGLTIFYSNDDFGAIQLSMNKIKAELKNANLREFKNYGHFTLFSMKTTKFPELLAECLTT